MDRDVDALLRYLEQRGPMPHAYGSGANDCLAFLAGAVKAQTGRNALGRISWPANEARALAKLRKMGGVEAVLDARFERVPPAQAHRGDIGGIADDQLGLHPVLVEGPTLATPGVRGLKRCPRTALVVAWDITKPAKPARKAKPKAKARAKSLRPAKPTGAR